MISLQGNICIVQQPKQVGVRQSEKKLTHCLQTNLEIQVACVGQIT